VSARRESGSCFCVAVIAEMRGDPFWVCFDHDADCRRATGSALVVWVCYSISCFDEGLPNELYVALGFTDHPECFRPEAHAYWREKLSWIEFADGLPRIDGYSRRRDPALGAPK
jgi:hypothetical protein